MTRQRNTFTRISSAAIGAFARDQLQNAERERPLVVISVPRGRSGYLVSPSVVAQRLGDRADVIALAEGKVGWELSKIVGGRLSCYWGAVRLYWPGFDPATSKAYEHPVWLSRRIESLGDDRVIDEIAERIAERATRPVPAVPPVAPPVEPPPIHVDPPPPPPTVVPIDTERDAEREQELATLRQRVEQAESELQRTRSELRDAHEDLEAELAARDAAEKERDLTRSDVQRVRSDLEAAHESLSTERTARESIEEERDKARVDAASLERERDHLAELVEMSADSVRDLNQQRITLEEQVHHLEGVVGAEAEKRREVEEQSQVALEEQEHRLRAHIEQAESDAQASERERETIAERLEAAEQTQRERVAEALRERDEAEARHSAATERIKELEAERAALRKRRETQGDDESLQSEQDLEEQRQRADAADEAVKAAREALARRLGEEREKHAGEVDSLREKRDKDVADLKKRADATESRLQGRIDTISRQRQEAVDERRKANDAASGLRRETDRLRARVQELETGEEIAELRAELERQQSSHKQTEAVWQGKFDGQERIAADRARQIRHLKAVLEARGDLPPEEEEPEQEEVSSMEDALLVSSDFDHLNFLASAFTSAEKYPFRHPQKVCESFKILSECAEERRGVKGLGKPIREWLPEKGVRYIQHESDTREHRLEAKLTFDVEGDTLLMKEHLRFGSGSKEQDALWVYMAWRDDPGEWVIGHVGNKIL